MPVGGRRYEICINDEKRWKTKSEKGSSVNISTKDQIICSRGSDDVNIKKSEKIILENWGKEKQKTKAHINFNPIREVIVTRYQNLSAWRSKSVHQKVLLCPAYFLEEQGMLRIFLQHPIQWQSWLPREPFGTGVARFCPPRFGWGGEEIFAF